MNYPEENLYPLFPVIISFQSLLGPDGQNRQFGCAGCSLYNGTQPQK